jgi:hypothetical protein
MQTIAVVRFTQQSSPNVVIGAAWAFFTCGRHAHSTALPGLSDLMLIGAIIEECSRPRSNSE